MNERCELLAKAKNMAIKKGLDSAKIDCPMIGVCTGARCYMFDKVGVTETKIAEYLNTWEKKTNIKQ